MHPQLHLQPHRKTVSPVKDLLFPRGQVHPVHRVLDKLLDLARCQGGRRTLLEHKRLLSVSMCFGKMHRTLLHTRMPAIPLSPQGQKVC